MATPISRFLLIGCCSAALVTGLQAAPRDVQFRSIDFETNVLELFNFGIANQTLNGWRFCTHDDNQTRRYTSSSGFSGMSLDAGESLFLHFDNNATGPGAINMSSLGGTVAGPLDRGPYGLGLYFNSGFGSGTNLADHVQWSIDGIDNTTADDRSDEAEGHVWTDQNLWVATTPTTQRLVLNDLTGAALHGPSDYDVIEPSIDGDYDGNGTVGLEDYAAWRNNFSSMANLDSDGSGNGIIDAADYTIWRDNLEAASIAVPEPPAYLFLAGLFLACCLRLSPILDGSADCGI